MSIFTLTKQINRYIKNGDYTMSASKLPLFGGIIQCMANFRDMTRMVDLLEKINDERVKGKRVANDDEYYRFLSDKETIINAFVEKGYSDEPKARKTYTDLTSPRFEYIREKTLGNQRVIELTSAGRSLIKARLWSQIRTGYWSEIIEKSSKKIGIVTAILICIATLINVMLAIYQ